MIRIAVIGAGIVGCASATWLASRGHEVTVFDAVRRPPTPDSLPVVGRHSSDRRILFAFGHGHLGLTLSATTGRMIADMAAGGEEPPDFSIKRFQK